MNKVEIVELVGGGYGIKRGYDPDNRPLYILPGSIVDIETKSGTMLDNARLDCLEKVYGVDDDDYYMILYSESEGRQLCCNTSNIKSIIDRTYDLKNQKYRTESPKTEPDMVNHPPHYISETGLEVIDVIEAFTFNLKGIEATDTGNILRYICRWKEKNGLQDLKKAQWYINHLINHVEKLEKENE